jgi:hypothetical protein
MGMIAFICLLTERRGRLHLEFTLLQSESCSPLGSQNHRRRQLTQQKDRSTRNAAGKEEEESLRQSDDEHDPSSNDQIPSSEGVTQVCQV